jgi:hypothetical protein
MLQQELSTEAYTKFANLVVASRAMETQSNVLREMREIEDRRNTMFMEQSRIVINNSLRSVQKITDSAFIQNRDTAHVLVKQNQDTYTLFMELMLRLKLNNTLPEPDIKDLSHMAMESRKDFVTAIKERQQLGTPNLELEEAPPVPQLKKVQPKPPEQSQDRMKKVQDTLDFDDVGTEESE